MLAAAPAGETEMERQAFRRHNNQELCGWASVFCIPHLHIPGQTLLSDHVIITVDPIMLTPYDWKGHREAGHKSPKSK